MTITPTRECLYDADDELLIQWWTSVMRAMKDPHRVELLRMQFNSRGLNASTSEVQQVLSTAKEQLMDEFKLRNISLPS